ncbi:E3 ubiquitin-protein ligase RAD18 isoform X2 [Ascaphus truei]|uniref:E3 ubiquitin-protein ligase RAD18 isoform X2 n=1 Tax=Ascaphus truei TaxID=8439 RepID=UPI003F59F78C
MATTPSPAPGGKIRPHVKVLDDLLRCGICFDYFNIAMIIPQCSHNYCSLCIRKFLSYKTQCPTCCVAVAEPELRNNRILDDLVKTFTSARPHLSEFIFNSPPMSPENNPSVGCSRKQDKIMDKFLIKTNHLTYKSTSKASTEKEMDVKLEVSPMNAFKEGSVGNPDLLLIASGSDTPSTSALKVHIKVECPVCRVGILENYMNNHLDSCLTRGEKKDSLRSSVHRRKSMAKVVYNLLSERDLRKKLKEVGLSAQGSKKHMIRRHQEFVQMFNAQCDSQNPKSAAEIVCEVENNEKNRSLLEAKDGERGMTFTKGQTEEEIEGIHQQYRRKHKSEFQQLVDQVKDRWRNAGGKKIKVKSEDCQISEEDHMMKDAGPCEDPAPDSDLLQGDVKGPLLSAEHLSVIRSRSPVFPLSPQSTASLSGARARKRKPSGPRTSSGEQITHRNKRRRK